MNPTSSISIREARLEDAATLADWACAMAWETEHKRLDPPTVLRGVHTVFEQPARGRYFMAERHGELAGTLMLTYEWSDWRCADWWWIQSVYVAPAHRRCGVYAALYRHVHALAEAAEGVCGLRLYVEKENEVAQRTYTSLQMRDAGYFMFEATLPWLGRVMAAGAE
jgi:ribosomal protein S18 acetylase RimI-like enzyme